MLVEDDIIAGDLHIQHLQEEIQDRILMNQQREEVSTNCFALQFSSVISGSLRERGFTLIEDAGRLSRVQSTNILMRVKQDLIHAVNFVQNSYQVWHAIKHGIDFAFQNPSKYYVVFMGDMPYLPRCASTPSGSIPFPPCTDTMEVRIRKQSKNGWGTTGIFAETTVATIQQFRVVIEEKVPTVIVFDRDSLSSDQTLARTVGQYNQDLVNSELNCLVLMWQMQYNNMWAWSRDSLHMLFYQFLGIAVDKELLSLGDLIVNSTNLVGLKLETLRRLQSIISSQSVLPSLLWYYDPTKSLRDLRRAVEEESTKFQP